jgi:hypothetical protein
MTKEKYVEASSSPPQARNCNRDSLDIDRRVPEFEDLEKHHFAVELADVYIWIYWDEIWRQAEVYARKRRDGIITMSDIQRAADDIKKGTPEDPSRPWLGIIGGAVFSAGLSFFINELMGSMNRPMIIISMVLVLFGFLLVSFSRSQS